MIWEGNKQMAVLQQVATIAFVLLAKLVQEAKAQNAWDVTEWTGSHATFYGDDSGAETMGKTPRTTPTVVSANNRLQPWPADLILCQPSNIWKKLKGFIHRSIISN